MMGGYVTLTVSSPSALETPACFLPPWIDGTPSRVCSCLSRLMLLLLPLSHSAGSGLAASQDELQCLQTDLVLPCVFGGASLNTLPFPFILCSRAVTESLVWHFPAGLCRAVAMKVVCVYPEGHRKPRSILASCSCAPTVMFQAIQVTGGDSLAASVVSLHCAPSGFSGILSSLY